MNKSLRIATLAFIIGLLTLSSQEAAVSQVNELPIPSGYWGVIGHAADKAIIWVSVDETQDQPLWTTDGKTVEPLGTPDLHDPRRLLTHNGGFLFETSTEGSEESKVRTYWQYDGETLESATSFVGKEFAHIEAAFQYRDGFLLEVVEPEADKGIWWKSPEGLQKISSELPCGKIMAHGPLAYFAVDRGEPEATLLVYDGNAISTLGKAWNIEYGCTPHEPVFGETYILSRQWLIHDRNFRELEAAHGLGAEVDGWMYYSHRKSSRLWRVNSEDFETVLDVGDWVVQYVFRHEGSIYFTSEKHGFVNLFRLENGEPQLVYGPLDGFIRMKGHPTRDGPDTSFHPNMRDVRFVFSEAKNQGPRRYFQLQNHLLIELPDGFRPHGSTGQYLLGSSKAGRPASLNVNQVFLANDEATNISGLRMESFPNPAGQAVTIRLQADEGAKYDIEVWDPLGRSIATLNKGYLGAGKHEFALDTSTMAGGVYLVRAASVDRVATTSVVVSGR